MPNYAHHTFDEGGVVIWHITESSDELYAMLATHKYDAQLSGKTNEGRRAEWLAVRLLIKQLFGDVCEIAYHPTGRPYLKHGAAHISISHTKGYATVAYHRTSPIGVDIEQISARVERIAHRFTSPSESAYIDKCEEGEREMYHLINWSAKETLYKLHDTPSMAEFKEAFHIAPYKLASCGSMQATIHRAEHSQATIHYHLFPHFVCTWAVLQ